MNAATRREKTTLSLCCQGIPSWTEPLSQSRADVKPLDSNKLTGLALRLQTEMCLICVFAETWLTGRIFSFTSEQTPRNLLTQKRKNSTLLTSWFSLAPILFIQPVRCCLERQIDHHPGSFPNYKQKRKKEKIISHIRLAILARNCFPSLTTASGGRRDRAGFSSFSWRISCLVCAFSWN